MTWIREQKNMGVVDPMSRPGPTGERLNSTQAVFAFSGSNLSGKVGAYVTVYDAANESFGNILDLATAPAPTGDDVADVQARHVSGTTWIGIWHETVSGVQKLKARRFTVSGTTCTALGSEVTINTGNMSTDQSIQVFEGQNKAVVGYLNTTGYTARLLTGLDVGITVNAATVLTSPTNWSGTFTQERQQIRALDSTYAIIAADYSESGGGFGVHAWLVSQGGTTLTEEDNLTVIRKNGRGQLSGHNRALVRENATTALLWGGTFKGDSGFPYYQQGLFLARLRRSATALILEKIIGWANDFLGAPIPPNAGHPPLAAVSQDLATVGNQNNVGVFAVLDYSNFVDEGVTIEEEIYVVNNSPQVPIGLVSLTDTLVIAPLPGYGFNNDWLVEHFTFRNERLLGVWQGGFELFPAEFQDTWQFSAIGTHTANDAMLFFSSYSSYGVTYQSYGITYQISASHVDIDQAILDEITNFITYNGNTYAAVYYQEIYPNIRGIGWT